MRERDLDSFFRFFLIYHHLGAFSPVREGKKLISVTQTWLCLHYLRLHSALWVSLLSVLLKCELAQQSDIFRIGGFVLAVNPREGIRGPH